MRMVQATRAASAAAASDDHTVESASGLLTNQLLQQLHGHLCALIDCTVFGAVSRTSTICMWRLLVTRLLSARTRNKGVGARLVIV